MAHFVAAIVATLLTLAVITDAADILFTTLYGSESDVIAVTPAMEALGARGHNVTYLTFLEPSPLPANVTVLPLTGLQTLVVSARREFFALDTMKIGEVAGWLMQVTVGVCDALLKDPAFWQLVENNRTRFDAVIMDPHLSDCGLPLVWLLGRPPLIYYSTTALRSLTAMALDIPSPFSYVPLHFLPYTDEMTFSQRYINTVHTMFLMAVRELHLKPLVERSFRKLFPSVPHVTDIERNTSFVFANSHSASMDLSRPLAPFFMEVGGTHCHPPRKLPKKFQDFIADTGDDGFIYVAIGSYISRKKLTWETIQTILDAFGTLRQKVIWKFDHVVTGVPTNVMLTRLAPQQDLLGHPNIRLFITQGEHLSLQEAVYHAVPILGLPLIHEHVAALTNLKQKGIAETLDYKHLDENIVRDSVLRVITNDRYRKSSVTYSRLFVDRPMKSIDTVVYWTEYIVRHKGGHHLRFNTDHLNFFQYFLLDVMAVMAIVLCVVGYAVFKLVRGIYALPSRIGLLCRTRSGAASSVQYKKLK